MTASSIVNLLLEADQPSATGRSGVYIFGPGNLRSGFYANDLNDAFARMEKAGYIKKGASKENGMVDWLVSTGHTFLIKVDPQNIEVIGPVPVSVTPEEQEDIEAFFGLHGHDRVMHKASQFDAGKPLDVEAVLRGSKQKEQAQAQAQAAEVEPPEAADGDEKSLAKGLKPRVNKLSPSIAIGFPLDDRETESVVCASEPVAGTGAAQAGIQKGDIICGVEKFVGRSGKRMGPYYIESVEDLLRVLCLASAKFPIPFRVLRGDAEHYIPIQPQARTTARPPAAATAATAPAMQPNQPPPARTTGNLPANVSSIT